jgi:flagellar hook-associated protein 2
MASGLDTRAIIDALLAVERRPIFQLEDRQAKLRSQKGLFEEFERKLEALGDKADAIRGVGRFVSFKVALDSEDYLTATVGAGAVAGSYEVKVQSLASAQTSLSAGRADANVTTHGSGTLLFTIAGETHAVEVGGTSGFSSTLQGIADAINAQGIDVQAQVVNTGQGTEPYKLMLTGKKTGLSQAFTVTADDADPPLSALVGELTTNTTAAKDAEILLNGVSIKRASNTISDVIPGVTLNLKGLHPQTALPTRVTVSTDTTATASKIKDFVDSYNALVDFVEAQNALEEGGQAKSPLFGDSTVRTIRGRLRDILGRAIDTGNQEFALLAQVGVTSDRTGKLTFDQAKFETALGADEDAVNALFTKDGAGIAARFHEAIEGMTDSVDGLFKARQDGFDRLIRDADRRIEQAEERIERYEQQLIERFAALETAMSRLQGQGSALAGFNGGNTGNRSR